MAEGYNGDFWPIEPENLSGRFEAVAGCGDSPLTSRIGRGKSAGGGGRARGSLWRQLERTSTGSSSGVSQATGEPRVSMGEGSRPDSSAPAAGTSSGSGDATRRSVGRVPTRKRPAASEAAALAASGNDDAASQVEKASPPKVKRRPSASVIAPKTRAALSQKAASAAPGA
eukprot:CAMPEP_0176073676 /NCGR_PEP_ID=MMETSP0120_2-20121206/36813_1 /TAXON_ID=160619 /ORGANISM="Kryptoperidinium foliaceum, Strain CCMP 1326" /LENGTH=170 /DNA_ID=CAMNT_0017407359 /DNA_START=64 /DNA_END=573 /DNA_ORIENTATION=-